RRDVLAPLQPHQHALMDRAPLKDSRRLYRLMSLLQEHLLLRQIGQQLDIIDVRQKDYLTPQTMGFGQAPNGNQACRLHAVLLPAPQCGWRNTASLPAPGQPGVTVCLHLVCPVPAADGRNPRAPADGGPDRRAVRRATTTGAPCRHPAWLRLDWSADCRSRGY